MGLLMHSYSPGKQTLMDRYPPSCTTTYKLMIANGVCSAYIWQHLRPVIRQCALIKLRIYVASPDEEYSRRVPSNNVTLKFEIVPSVFLSCSIYGYLTSSLNCYSYVKNWLISQQGKRLSLAPQSYVLDTYSGIYRLYTVHRQK